MSRKLYKTANGLWIEDGEMCYWNSGDKWEYGIFSVEYRYGELYEIQLGYTRGGYSTRYGESDIARDVYKNKPKEDI